MSTPGGAVRASGEVAPGPGTWRRETTHQQRPFTRYHRELFVPGFDAAMRAALRRYGGLLERIEMREVRGWIYSRPRPVGAPEQPRPLPPRAVFRALFWVHPELRRRRRAAAWALATRPWRAAAERWEQELRDRFAGRAEALQAVELPALPDGQLRAHLDDARSLVQEGMLTHFEHSACHMIAVGDWLARTAEWTATPPAEALGALRGASPSSLRPLAGLDRLAAAIRASEQAKQELERDRPAAQTLTVLRGTSPAVAVALDAYLDEHGEEIVTGFALDDLRLRELPDALVASVRARLQASGPDRSASSAEAQVEALRSRVPDGFRGEWETLLADAKLLYGLRDDDGALTSGRPYGLLRRALLEAGARLAANERLAAPEHIFDASPDEVDALLAGQAGAPSAAELSRRHAERLASAADPPPETLGGGDSPPPPTDWLPPACARINEAMLLALSLDNFDQAPAEPQPEPRRSGGPLEGLAASPGRYQGPARLVREPADFCRLQHGDVLVAPITSGAYNVVLPMIGAIVTDRGGALSHPAIIAREFAIPAVVGTGEATSRLSDGALVEVDGDRGTVTPR